tara:strand:- start:361 stop:1479 length:1119 start_codon:yes stop_codon:yes gene_type:complete
MPESSSYTGEDSFEIQCHGGNAIITSFYDALSSIKNVRIAEQGEFTKRAIINGKMNLIDAEALNDLIHAEAEQQRILAMKQLDNSLSVPIQKWRKLLLISMSNIEARIDFSDEEDIPGDQFSKKHLLKLKKEIDKTLKNGQQHDLIKEGLKIVLTGKPNAGKSSLFNYIVKGERSIVTDMPGTTRDTIEVKVNIGGYIVTFVDTAGINKTSDIIEQEGIKRAKHKVNNADLVLNIIDAPKFNQADINPKYWNVLNKIDKSPIEDIKVTNSLNFYKVSAKSGEGVNFLLQEILSFVIDNTKKIRNTNNFYSSNRQKKELEAIKVLLDLALKEDQEEILAEFIREINKGFGRILGHVDIEEVLGEIFSNFCIGK